jgi:hypothetical protein
MGIRCFRLLYARDAPTRKRSQHDRLSPPRPPPCSSSLSRTSTPASCPTTLSQTPATEMSPHPPQIPRSGPVPGAPGAPVGDCLPRWSPWRAPTGGRPRPPRGPPGGPVPGLGPWARGPWAVDQHAPRPTAPQDPSPVPPVAPVDHSADGRGSRHFPAHFPGHFPSGRENVPGSLFSGRTCRKVLGRVGTLRGQGGRAYCPGRAGTRWEVAGRRTMHNIYISHSNAAPSPLCLPPLLPPLHAPCPRCQSPPPKTCCCSAACNKHKCSAAANVMLSKTKDNVGTHESYTATVSLQVAVGCFVSWHL